jgi:Coatomer epsilon subunit
VQLYIRIDRLDLAESQVKVMKHADEDSTLSMLASAWTNLSVVSPIFLWCVVVWCGGE